MWSSFLHPPTLQKRPFFPLQFGQEENICGWKLRWKKSLLICFENFQGVPCFHRQSRNRMMNTFIIDNITSIFKRQFRWYIYACALQKGLSSHFTWHSFERRAYSLLLRFETYHKQQAILFTHFYLCQEKTLLESPETLLVSPASR